MKRIRLVLSIDVDPDEWAYPMSEDRSRDELREEVRRYAYELIRDCPAAQVGGITEVRWVR